MWGNSSRWDPWAYATERWPDVQVVEAPLPGSVQACYDPGQRIIWLDAALTRVEARCALAYQLGHLEYGPNPQDPYLAAAHHRAAVEWAALMLVPSDVFAAAWAGCLDLAAMAAYANVDLSTFRARIRAASDADQDAAVEAIAATRLSA